MVRLGQTLSPEQTNKQMGELARHSQQPWPRESRVLCD